MKVSSLDHDREKERLHKWASLLALIAILYNLREGLVSVFFGLEDETMAFFGFVSILPGKKPLEALVPD